MAVEAGPNVLVPVITVTVRQVFVGKLRSHRIVIVSDVLWTLVPLNIGEVLHTQGAKLYRNLLREQVDEIVGA